MPIQSNYFSSAISNSVLEHIPNLRPVLLEVKRILKPGGQFIFCVPNQRLLNNLHIRKLLKRFGLVNFSEKYAAFFNKISRHYHADSEAIWMERLVKSGFQLDNYWHYFSPRFTKILEWGHYLGLPSLISKRVFGKWIQLPFHWNPLLRERFLRKYFNQNPIDELGSYTFYIARKR